MARRPAGRTRRTAALASGVVAVAAVATLGVAPGAFATPTADVTAPSAPANITMTRATDHSVSIAWTRSSDTDWDHWIDPDGPFFGYRVYQGDTLLGTTLDESYTVSGLAADQPVTLWVQSYDRQDNRSARSPITVRTTQDVAAPIAPVHFLASSVNPDTVELRWSQVPDAGRIDYVIEGSTSKVVANPMSGSGTVSTRVPTTDTGTYSYTIRVRDEAGNMSTPKSVSLNVEHVAPTAPSNLRMVSGVPDHPQVIAWDPATDNSGKVFYSVFVGDYGVATTTGTSVNVADAINTIIANAFDFPTGRQRITVVASDPSQNVSARSNSIDVVV